MKVALLTSFTASRKEPLAEVLNRVHLAFTPEGVGEPLIQFNFGDSATASSVAAQLNMKRVSSVDRVLKRFPDLEQFVTVTDPMPGIQGSRRISNGPHSPAAGQSVAFEMLLAIAEGVPRSFPFHSIKLHFFTDLFGSLGSLSPRLADMIPGVLLSDSWWVNGRNRSLSACTIVEADPAAKKLPPLPDEVAKVLDACGKIRSTKQLPLPGEAEIASSAKVQTRSGLVAASADPKAVEAVKPILADYRARLSEIVERAQMPHDLPPQNEAPRLNPNQPAGPRKPTLNEIFGPMGYSCKGGSGTFTLHRRSSGNLTVRISIDVGTWSHNFLAHYIVMGLGYAATLSMPAAPRATPGQYPLTDAEQWRKIVENLAALTRKLDASFVPDIEKAAGPSPDWYHPEK
jgi:hypothetical protein